MSLNQKTEIKEILNNVIKERKEFEFQHNFIYQNMHIFSDKYKVNATVLEYLPDNTLLRYWELQGCWVTGISETGYDSESGNKKTVTATIRYDRAIPHRPE